MARYPEPRSMMIGWTCLAPGPVGSTWPDGTEMLEPGTIEAIVDGGRKARVRMLNGRARIVDLDHPEVCVCRPKDEE